MNRTKELAEQAGLPLIADQFMTASQEKFAELIRSEEREACAKLCEDEAKAKLWLIGLRVVQSEIIQRDRAKQWSLAAKAIRARGNNV